MVSLKPIDLDTAEGRLAIKDLEYDLEVAFLNQAEALVLEKKLSEEALFVFEEFSQWLFSEELSKVVLRLGWRPCKEFK